MLNARKGKRGLLQRAVAWITARLRERRTRRRRNALSRQLSRLEWLESQSLDSPFLVDAVLECQGAIRAGAANGDFRAADKAWSAAVALVAASPEAALPEPTGRVPVYLLRPLLDARLFFHHGAPAGFRAIPPPENASMLEARLLWNAELDKYVAARLRPYGTSRTRIPGGIVLAKRNLLQRIELASRLPGGPRAPALKRYDRFAADVPGTAGERGPLEQAVHARVRGQFGSAASWRTRHGLDDHYRRVFAALRDDEFWRETISSFWKESGLAAAAESALFLDIGRTTDDA